MASVLILGSGPNVTEARDWPRDFDLILAINNAWAVRPDWDELIHAYDFAPERMPPVVGAGQRIVTEAEFVPAQNALGGFVYAGGTMAFTAAYYALDAHRPRVLAFFGCDMVYPSCGRTHFYGTGSPDPLRADPTLQSLEAKSARLMVLAARAGCAAVNLSTTPSRLVLQRTQRADWRDATPLPFDMALTEMALTREKTLDYHVASGRYWEEIDRFDPAELRALDAMWLAAAGIDASTLPSAGSGA